MFAVSKYDPKKRVLINCKTKVTFITKQATTGGFVFVFVFVFF